MTNHNKIEAVIKEACPGLMELTPGCEVYLRYSRRVYTLVLSHVGPPFMDNSFTGCYASDKEIKSANSKDVEIIGHPIRLDSVLVALNTIVIGASNYLIDNTGALFKATFPNNSYSFERCCKFDLTKPLSGQKEEVWEFLGEVLVGEEK